MFGSRWCVDGVAGPAGWEHWENAGATVQFRRELLSPPPTGMLEGSWGTPIASFQLHVLLEGV